VTLPLIAGLELAEGGVVAEEGFAAAAAAAAEKVEGGAVGVRGMATREDGRAGLWGVWRTEALALDLGARGVMDLLRLLLVVSVRVLEEACKALPVPPLLLPLLLLLLPGVQPPAFRACVGCWPPSTAAGAAAVDAGAVLLRPSPAPSIWCW